MNVVIDASAAAKLLVPEMDSDKARQLFARWEQRRLTLEAPEILPAEVASSLWKRVMRGLLLADEARALQQRFTRLSIPLVSIEELVDRALALALRHQHSVYDGLYTALALSRGWDFITADEKLFRKLVSSMPQIRLLRDFV